MSAAPILALIRHGELIRELAIRDAKEINKGAALGGAWLVLRPLIQTVGYVAIVSCVLHSRLTQDGGAFDYALFVLGGMVPWQLLVHALAVSPSLIRSNADVVKQIVYPIETLPMRSLLVGSLASLVTLGVYVVLAAATGSLHWSILLLPVPLLTLMAMLVGLSWILMVFGAFIADLREMVGAALNVMIFFTPVLISPAMVGPRVWTWIRWNPFTHAIICFRDVLLGQFHADSWLLFSVTAAVALFLGSSLVARFRLKIPELI